MDIQTERDPYLRRVLQALRLNRQPGWHFPGYYLGLTYDGFGPDCAELSLPVDAMCTNLAGDMLPAALAVLADVTMAGAVRRRVGVNCRLATASMALRFSGVRPQGKLCARGTCRFEHASAKLPLAFASIEAHSGGVPVFTGEATFVVFENKAGTAPHPLPGPRDFDTIEPLDSRELDGAESVIFGRAIDAVRPQGSEPFSFLERLWGLTPRSNNGEAICEFPCGPHVGNRVGHAQGGILFGLAAQTSLQVLGTDWTLIDISASFLTPGDGGALTAKARPTRVGRAMATVNCDIIDAAGALTMQSHATLAAREP